MVKTTEYNLQLLANDFGTVSAGRLQTSDGDSIDLDVQTVTPGIAALIIPGGLFDGWACVPVPETQKAPEVDAGG